MEVLSNIGKKITNAGQSAITKTKNMADISKLNGQVSGEENKIRGLYAQIGKLYFELYPDTPDERLAPLCASIRESLLVIESCNEQITEIKGIKRCPQCGAEIASAAAFCSVCGCSMTACKPQEADAEAPCGPKCPKCGFAAVPGDAFCGNCGNKMG